MLPAGGKLAPPCSISRTGVSSQPKGSIMYSEVVLIRKKLVCRQRSKFANSRAMEERNREHTMQERDLNLATTRDYVERRKAFVDGEK